MRVTLDPDDPFQPIDQQTLRETVTNSVRQAILGGTLKPGSQINQVEVAAKLRVSRGPLREALRQLEEEGLVLSLPHKGTYVTQVTTADIEEVYSIRAVLETFAVRRAVEHATEDELDELSDIVCEMEKAAEIGDVSSLRALDLQFHLTICRAAHHQLLLQLWKSIELRVRRVLALRHGIYKDPRDIVGTHPDIARALQARDLAQATSLMGTHVRDSCEHLLAVWLNS
jgi:DNA-binding GntR family transcriptional regulator